MTRAILINMYNFHIRKPKAFKTHEEAWHEMMDELACTAGCTPDEPLREDIIIDPSVSVSWNDFGAGARCLDGNEVYWAIYEIEV